MNKLLLGLIIGILMFAFPVEAQQGQDFCSPGQTKCGGIKDKVLQCNDDNGDGFYEWSIYGQVFCPNGCINGACVSDSTSCENYCQIGDRRCGGQGFSYVQPCADDNGDGCFGFSIYGHRFCENGCLNGECLNEEDLGCQNFCDIGQSRCTGPGLRYIANCADDNGDGCFGISAFDQEICEFGCTQIGEQAFCNSMPIDTCENLCSLGQTKCGGNSDVIMTCGDDNGDGCLGMSIYNQEYCPYGCTQISASQAECNSLEETNIHLSDSEDPTGYTSSDLRFFWDFEDLKNDINLVDFNTFDIVRNASLTSKAAEGNVSPSLESKFGAVSINFSADDGDALVFSNLNAIPGSFDGSMNFWLRNLANGTDLDNILWHYNNGLTNWIQISHDSDGTLKCWLYNAPYSQVLNSITNFSNTTDWHHISCQWGSKGMQLYIDGFREDSNLSFFNNYGIAEPEKFQLAPAVKQGNIFIDDIAIFGIQIDFNITSLNHCNFNQTKCGGIGKKYIILCGDNNNDGFLEWSITNQTYCDFGCFLNGTKSQCYTAPAHGLNISFCSSSETKCDINEQYQIPCADDNSDGLLEWSKNNWTFCKHGCNKFSGVCISCYDKCDLGDSICRNLGKIRVSQTTGERILSDSGEWQLGCVLNPFTGCREYSVLNATRCDYGCSQTFNIATNTSIAECTEPGSTPGHIRNMFNGPVQLINNFAPDDGSKMMFVGIFAFIVLGLMSVITKSWEAGTIGGLSVILVAGFIGWITPFIVLGLGLLSAFILWRTFFANSM